MAVDAGTSLTFDVASNREDLTDIIYNVDPVDTPFITRVATNSARATLHEWPVDTLNAATADNAVAQGDSATITDMTDPTRLNNNTQLLNKTPSVSSTQQAVDSAGIDDYFDYQIVKGTQEIRRDLESSLMANKVKSAGSRGTAAVLGGIDTWINTNASVGATGTAGANGDTLRVAGTARAFTETLYRQNQQSIWDNGGQPDLTITTSFNKGVASGFAGNATRFKQAEDQQLIGTIDIYKGDFSELEIVASRWLQSQKALNLQTDMFAVAWLQPCGWEYLAKTGNSDEALISCEATMESRNEKASGAIFDLTSS